MTEIVHGRNRRCETVTSARRDQRSLEAETYRPLYKTARWQRIRQRQLSAHPLCQRCEGRGKVVVATVCHHTIEHKGDMALFYGGPFESLCKPCHDGPAQQVERIGYSTEVGADGWPTDERHPANR